MPPPPRRPPGDSRGGINLVSAILLGGEPRPVLLLRGLWECHYILCGRTQRCSCRSTQPRAALTPFSPREAALPREKGRGNLAAGDKAATGPIPSAPDSEACPCYHSPRPLRPPGPLTPADVRQGGWGYGERLRNLGRGPVERKENPLSLHANRGLASSAGHPSPPASHDQQASERGASVSSLGL